MFSGYVDGSQELVQVLDNYRTKTSTRFSNAQSLALALKPIDETQLRTRFLSISSKPRLFWQMNAGEPKIPCDGVPFILIGQITDLPCVRFGGRRKKNEQVTLPTGEVMPIECRQKAGCDAKITIRRIARYPSAAYIDPVISPGIAQVRRSRKLLLDDLVSKIASGATKLSERYFLLLPTPMAHSGHEVSEIETTPLISQPISDAILSQLSTGVTSIHKIQEHCHTIGMNILGPEASLHSKEPSCFPSEYDIFRHVYWLYKAGQVIDQEAALRTNMGTLDSLAPTVTTTLSKTSKVSNSTTADAINSVYSLILDDGSTSEVTALGNIGDGMVETGDNTVTLDSIDSTTLRGINSTSSSAASNLSQLVKRVAQTPKPQTAFLANNRTTDSLEVSCTLTIHFWFCTLILARL